ncbi:MAG: esterase-like activity of phytase family protein [Flammeovirgaceae bacterium]
MPKITLNWLALLCLTLISCRDENTITPPQISGLRFIGEQVIPYNTQFQSSTVGGLSAIDYHNNTWFLLSDDKNEPRFYTATLSFDEDSFHTIELLAKVDLLDINNQAFQAEAPDPEALRLHPKTNQIIWTSEGDMNKGINPFVRIASPTGQFINEIELPELFHANSSLGGPRLNGVFEGVCIDTNYEGYWVSLEEPLIQDGEEASFFSSEKSPIRISYINQTSTQFGEQYAYQLDKVARRPIPSDGFSVNGVVELLALSKTTLLVLERSYAVGYVDGGNNVKIYQADLTHATDVSKINALATHTFTPVTKTLLFDFETIRDELTQNRVDNIEGMAFGPTLPNGNRSLVLVSDNNFNPIQLTQLLVFEVMP